MNVVTAALLRMLRVAVVTAAASWWAHHQGMTLTDVATVAGSTGVVSGIAKALRDKFPGWFEWLPF